MLVKEFSGKSEKEAVSKALEELNLTEDQVRIEVIDKGKRNLFGLGEESPTIIRVYYEEISTNLGEFQSIVSNILKYIGVEAEVTAKEESEKRIYINISTEDSGVLIGKKGATLEALQFITSKLDNTKANSTVEEEVKVNAKKKKRKRKWFLTN